MTNYDKYNWDLEDILQGKSLESLYEEWIKSENKLIKLVASFYKTLPLFKQWIKLGEENEIISNRLHNYISNKLQEDITDQKYIAWEQKLSMKSHELSKYFVGLSNKFIEHKALIRKYLKDKSLKEYTREFEIFFKEEKHILPKEENAVLNEISINNGAVHSIFSTLEQDITFEDAKDSKGKKHKLITQSDVNINLKNNDRTLRKNSWINFNKAFAQFDGTFTQTLYYNYLKLNTYAKLHKYENYIERTCEDDEINFSLIESIYKNVETFKETYLDFRKETIKKLKAKLHLKKIEPWDYSLDLSKTKINFTIEEAQQTVLDALSILGPQYQEYLKTALKAHWVSFMPKKNKYTGAYSIGGTKGLNKFYILMNFDGTYDSVSTLAHELGHSLNSVYFNKAQKVYAETTIFTAEIPSILNETLLALYMINKHKDNKELVNNFIREICDGFFGTTTFPIILSNFEYEANKLVNEAKPFTKESIKNIYRDMTIKYRGGKKKELKEPYSYGISSIFRINHFYSGNFYVYKYAVGQIAAICFANKIINKEPGALDKLFTFLKSGTSKSPLETIKLLGIDMTKKEPYVEAINFIKKLLKIYKK